MREQDDRIWQEREWERFSTGEYTIVPWSGEWWATTPYTRLHFPHLIDDKVAFTSTNARGLTDTKTLMRPGKYLRRFYAATLSESQIQEWAEGVATLQIEVKFATTPDEITRVYLNGPDSCMSSEFKKQPVHPAAVYGAGDLAIAYMERNGKVVARVLCWPEKKVYAHPDATYGKDYIEVMLHKLGYHPSGREGAEFRGARLLAVPLGLTLVVPDLPTRTVRVQLYPDGFLRIRKKTGIRGWCDSGATFDMSTTGKLFDVKRREAN